jgi:hypothetical protein
MILTLDRLAERYHCLPSEALARGTTFDLHVMDTTSRHQRYQQTRAELEYNLKSGRTQPVAPPSEEQMQAMINRVRGQK